MAKKTLAMLLAGMLAVSATACGSTADTDGAADETAEATEDIEEDTEAEAVQEEETDSTLGTVDNTLAEDTDALVAAYADKFEQVEYADAESGLSVTYNLYLPEDYDENGFYPTVVFIADSSCVGDDATRSLTQGRGALVWASDEWQSVNPSIVVVPSYPETILDDHDGYATTEYVELTKRLIDAVSEEYAVDTGRIYGTGQSMGCMTTLILASEYPDLYAACMFVDGQWDVSTLSSLEEQTFVYFAAEDDVSAYNGLQEVMEMFDADGAAYSYEQWDGTWSADELTDAAEALFTNGTDANFISWKTGTIDADSAMGGFGGGPQGDKPDGDGGSQGGDKPDGDAPEKPDRQDGNAPQMGQGGGETDSAPNGESGDGGNGSGGMGGVAYHMASFDYAYNCIAVMEWLFAQE